MNSISPLIAMVVIVAIVIGLSIAVALWLSGFVSITGYGTEVTKLDMYYLRGYGALAKILVKNTGSETVSIDRVFLNGKPVMVRTAYDLNDPDNFMLYIETTIEKNPYTLPPGHTAEIWIIPERPLQAGVTYEVKIHTATGHVFFKPINAEITTSISNYQLVLIALQDRPALNLFLNASSEVEIYINNKDLGTYTSPYLDPSKCSKKIDLGRGNKRVLKPGENLISIKYATTSDYPFINLALRIRKRISFSRRSWDDLFSENNTWKYLIRKNPPSKDRQGHKWYDPQYDDSSWNLGEAPLGDYGYYATYLKPPINRNVYLRKRVVIPSTIDGVPVESVEAGVLRLSSNGSISLWVNGQKILDDANTDKAMYWNYNLSLPLNSLGVSPSSNLVFAVSVGDIKNRIFYFDSELVLYLKLENGSTIKIIYPERIPVKYLELDDESSIPNDWWKTNFDDSSWRTGYLPIGMNQIINNGYITPNTYSGKKIILIRIKVELDLPMGTNSGGYYSPRDTGYRGRAIIFDMVKWRYRYYNVFNPTGVPSRINDYVFIGSNGNEGTIEEVLEGNVPPLYEGNPPIIDRDYINASNYEAEPTSPILLFINMKRENENNLTWLNLKSGFIDRFVMHAVKNAIPGMDIIVLWEDLWYKPSWHHRSSDGRSWVDHVVRVTWLEDGEVRVGVYRCSGGYLHVFYINNRFVYYKPHSDTWGDRLGTNWTYREDLNNDGAIGSHEYTHYEIGYDPKTGKISVWISPSGFEVTVWRFRP